MAITPLTGGDLEAAIRRVRLLLNDVAQADQVFSADDITDFLALEGWNVKLAAAQAIDTNASNEALASKVLRTQDLSTDGAKLADALRKHAAVLREQVAAELEDEEGSFEFVTFSDCRRPPELTEWPRC